MLTNRLLLFEIEEGSASDSPCEDGLAGGEVRCGCGSLLGRVVAEGLELKCRRCKRTFVVPIESESEQSS